MGIPLLHTQSGWLNLAVGDRWHSRPTRGAVADAGATQGAAHRAVRKVDLNRVSPGRAGGTVGDRTIAHRPYHDRSLGIRLAVQRLASDFRASATPHSCRCRAPARVPKSPCAAAPVNGTISPAPCSTHRASALGPQVWVVQPLNTPCGAGLGGRSGWGRSTVEHLTVTGSRIAHGPRR